MSSQVILILYAVGIGFVIAGLLNAIHQTVAIEGEDEKGQFILYFDTPVSTVWSIVVCIFAGPYLVLKNGHSFWRDGHLPFSAMLVCTFISCLWSLCSGIVLVEFGYGLGLLS